MLTARLQAPKRHWPHDPPLPVHTRVLCGVVNCSGELATTFSVCWNHSVPIWKHGPIVHFDAGFVEEAPGRWALGKHAQRSRRHAPRRPKLLALDYGDRLRQGRRSMVVAHDVAGPTHVREIALAYQGIDGRIRSVIHSTGWLEFGARLMITCPRCGRQSALVIENPARREEAIPAKTSAN